MTFERTPGERWISCYVVILNGRDQSGDCIPAGNVRHTFSNAKSDCNNSSKRKLNSAENQRISHCILTFKCSKQCDSQTKAIWGNSIFCSCGVSPSASSDSVFLSQNVYKMRQRACQGSRNNHFHILFFSLTSSFVRKPK